MSAIVSFVYVIKPVIDMREAPDARAEIVSQSFFSEQVQVLEEQKDWVKIVSCVDSYVGWVERNALCFRDTLFLPKLFVGSAKVNRLCAHLYDCEDTIFGPILSLPFESRLQVVNLLDLSTTSRWIKVLLPNGREGFIQRGDIVFNQENISREEMCVLSKRFLDLPYTWGGRSSFGYDCSGFTQMLYRQMGVFLPRDAKDQMQSSLLENVLIEELHSGDLIFFGRDEQKIRHMGMYLGEDAFIHATVAENAPYIHISKLSSLDWSGGGGLPYRAMRTLRDS